MKVIYTLVTIVISTVLAEPPVPSNTYVPANQYIPPSNQYGAPAQTEAIIKPNNQYGPPTNTYGPPTNTYGPPTNTYGPPTNTYGPPKNGYLPPNGGYGKQEEVTEPASYQFEYHVEDPPSGNDFGHQEQREGDVAQGKYFVLLPDGRRQTVEYVADQDGYRPKITYEQVGGYPSGGPSDNGGYQY